MSPDEGPRRLDINAYIDQSGLLPIPPNGEHTPFAELEPHQRVSVYGALVEMAMNPETVDLEDLNKTESDALSTLAESYPAIAPHIEENLEPDMVRNIWLLTLRFAAARTGRTTEGLL